MNLKGLTITQIKKDIDSGKYSYEELISETRKTIEELDPKLHVFVSRTDEKAQQSGDRQLAGIPASLKDNFNWKGTKTTASSNILKNYTSPYNATVTERLLAAGAFFMGKTNMDAFAHGSSTEKSDFFTTLNPYNKKHVAGGSSGGAAAAVATGMSVYSIGSETAGSVRGPAAWCGVYGFAPTYGRFSRYGLIAMGSSLDRPGILANSIEDIAILTEILSGHDPKDATSIDEPAMKLVEAINSFKLEDLGGLKLGVPKNFMDERIDSEVRNKVQEAIDLLKKNGADVKEIALFDQKYALAVYTVISRSEISSNLARIDGIRYGHRSSEQAETFLDQIAYNRQEGFGNEAKQRSMTGAYTLSAGYYDAYYKRAQQVRTLIIEDFKQVFQEVDLIIGPTMPMNATKIGDAAKSPIFGELMDELAEPSALAGLPCLSVPVGFDSKGLPTGMQIFGKQKDELGVLKLGRIWEILSE
ncbi:Asp-tRNA(Asn)/Glu-tRNA(Gln) amidotransferase subunit GatA [Candidatus Dojkabacteria bacterium]|nr:Asp-tRNA(Asn)/Glu-tRNA(Gln) amidotransferase subunit GatA [Candidatus Dojkabacteria bacterium]